MNQSRRSRFASQGGEIITPPFVRRRGGFWIQDFVITPEALEQGGSEMSKIAETFDTILALAEAKLDSIHRDSGS